MEAILHRTAGGDAQHGNGRPGAAAAEGGELQVAMSSALPSLCNRCMAPTCLLFAVFSISRADTCDGALIMILCTDRMHRKVARPVA